MNLSNLKPAEGSIKHSKRIGRGAGSGKGGTATRGNKGAKARSGLNALAEAKNITDFNIDVLKENGLISGKDRIKILGRGELAKAVNVTAHAFSATAKKAIEDKGGVATVIE